jgi:hypothetical protein
MFLTVSSQDDFQFNITALTVGINRSKWISINENEIEINSEKPFHIMKENRFDQLPIISTNGNIFEYFKTERPNDFTDIKREKIEYTDTLSEHTNIEEVIRAFVNNKKTFYFLVSNKLISGLITVGNLNCKQVQVHLFSYICDLERSIGEFVNCVLDKKAIEDFISIKSGNKNRYKKMLKEYQELIVEDLENKLTEHFYFIDFFDILHEKDLFLKLGYSKSEYVKFKSINELRIRVAHPTKSLINKKFSINQLKEKFELAKELQFKLNMFLKNTPN